MFKKELNINSRESTEVVMVSDYASDTQRNIAVKAEKRKKDQAGLVPKAKINK